MFWARQHRRAFRSVTVPSGRLARFWFGLAFGLARPTACVPLPLGAPALWPFLSFFLVAALVGSAFIAARCLGLLYVVVEAFVQLLVDCLLDSLAGSAVNHLRHGQGTHCLDRRAALSGALVWKDSPAFASGQEGVAAHGCTLSFYDRHFYSVLSWRPYHSNRRAPGYQLARYSDWFLLLCRRPGFWAHFEVDRCQGSALIFQSCPVHGYASDTDRSLSALRLLGCVLYGRGVYAVVLADPFGHPAGASAREV